MAEDAPAEPTRPADEPGSPKTEPTPKKLEDDEVPGKSEEHEKKKDEVEEGEVNFEEVKDGSQPPLPDEEVNNKFEMDSTWYGIAASWLLLEDGNTWGILTN